MFEFVGTEQKWQTIKKGGTRKLQILDVRLIDPAAAALTTSANFITTHSEFASHDILMKPNVMLYCIAADTVYFIQHDEKEHLLDTRKHPIVFLSQTALAKKLIRMPRKDFLSFCKALNLDHVKNAVLMFNGVRSGTTAYTQMFNALPGWIAISEIMPLFALFESHGNGILDFVRSAEFETITESLIKFNLKNIPASADGVFIKMTVFDEHMAPLLMRLFPRFKLILAYRNVKAAGKSFQKVFLPIHVEAALRLAHNPLTRDTVATRQRLMNTLGYVNDFVKQLLAEVRPQEYIEWYVLQWAIRIHLLSQAEINQGSKIYPLRYEDFMKDQAGSLATLFDYLGIDQKNLGIALESFKVDSQEGTFMSKKARVNNTDWIRTEGCVARCNRILNAFNLPDFDSDFHYMEWINHKQK